MSLTPTLTLSSMSPEDAAALFPHRPILTCYRGSIAHGMYTGDSSSTGIDDVDLLCCYIPDLEHYFGLPGREWSGRDTKRGKWDVAAYEVRHLAHLLAAANPNVLSSLWLKPEMYVELTPEGKMLVEARHLFSSKRAAKSFGGYAYGQLKRMTAYHELGEDRCCAGEQFHTPECPLTQERGRGSQKKFATGYMGEKRKALVERHGYDTKNAAHLIRLLRMGREFLRTGELVVDRRDAGDDQSLLAIKRGEYTLERIQSMARDEFSALDSASLHCMLPEQPDTRLINDLLVGVLSYAKHSEITLRAVALQRVGKTPT